MKSTYFIIGLVLSLLQACQLQDTEPYNRRINALRHTRDSFFKLSIESPIGEKEQVSFLSLDYFKPDKSFVTTATIDYLANPDTFFIENTQGDDSRMLKFATFHFSLKGKSFDLFAFTNTGYKSNQAEIPVFLPFSDSTTGKSTYEAGRYIEFKMPRNQKTVEIDFNKAFNPFCAYSPRYSCPIAPRENHINLSIFAGEKMYDPAFGSSEF